MEIVILKKLGIHDAFIYILNAWIKIGFNEHIIFCSFSVRDESDVDILVLS